jgi:hypothetical protein
MKVELFTREGCDETGCCLACGAVEEMVGKAVKSLYAGVEWEFVHGICGEKTCCPELPCLAVDGRIVLSGSGWRENDVRKAIIDEWKGKRDVKGQKRSGKKAAQSHR